MSLIAAFALSLDDSLSSESGSDSQAHGIGELPLLREDLSLLHLSTDRVSVSFDSYLASTADSACEVGGEGCRGAPDECHDSTLWKDSSLSRLWSRG